MLVIFGVKRMVRRLATVFAMCSRCGSPAAQVIARRTTWFSLFFIPVIPLGSTYSSTCTFCGVATRLDKDQALHMVELAQRHRRRLLGASRAASVRRREMPDRRSCRR